MKNWTKRIIAVLCSLAMVLSGLAISVPQEVKAADSEPTYVTLDGFENVTIKDFSKDGAVMPSGEYACTDAEYGNNSYYSLSDGTSLDGKLLAMELAFTNGGGSKERLDVAGSGEWSGFMLYPNEDGSHLFLVSNSDAYGTTEEFLACDVSATTAEVDSFLGNEFLLQLSFDFGDADDNNKADIQVGVYVNGKHCADYTFAGCNMAKFGGYISVYRQAENAVITVNSVKFLVEPVELVGFETLTVEDFKDEAGNKMLSGEYEGSSAGGHSVYAKKDISNLDKKLVSMKIIYEGGSYKHSLIIGGNGGWCGFSLHPNNDGTALTVDNSWAGSITSYAPFDLSAAVAGVSSFINNEILLQLSFDYGEVDENNKADLALGIYIDGKLYNNQPFIFEDCDMNASGNVLALYREVDGSSIIVNSITEPIMPDESFERITFANYGIMNEKYPYVAGDLAVQGSVAGRTTLDKTVTCGSILMEGSNSSQIIWGGKSGWDGLRMFPSSDGYMTLTWFQGNDSTPVATLYSNLAGVAFIGEEYDIMLSAELVDNGGDGNVNDIKIGIWFNGVLYNQEYIYATDLGDQFGTCFSVYCATAADAVTVASESELLKQPGEHLDKVTFLHYGVEDGTYDHANVSGAYPEIESANGSVLCGDVRLSGSQEIDLMWGFTDNSWFGVRLTKYGDSTDLKFIFQTQDSYTEPLTIKPGLAGVDFNNETFNLMWSMELVDSDGDESMDDLEVGLWFNGFLYLNQYCYITDYPLSIGNKIETYCAEGSTITFTSDEELSSTVPVRHDLIHFEAVAPGCHSNGNVEYWYCSKCEGFWTDAACTQETNSEDVILSATGSDYVTYMPETESTTTEAGNYEYWYCSACDKYFADGACTIEKTLEQFKKPLLEHVCVGTKTDAITATCTTPGNSAYWTCECGKIYADEDCAEEILLEDTVIPAGHKSEDVAAKEATCTEAGCTAGAKCSVCGEILSGCEATPLAGHTVVKVPGKAATVNATGLTDGKKCKNCDWEEKGKVIPKIAKPGATKITKATGAKKKITIKFKKVSGINGYEIELATNKKMKKGLKKATVKATKSQYVAKKLKAKTNYWVRVRTYKLVNGEKVYSKWTAKKKVKTK